MPVKCAMLYGIIVIIIIDSIMKEYHTVGPLHWSRKYLSSPTFDIIWLQKGMKKRQKKAINKEKSGELGYRLAGQSGIQPSKTVQLPPSLSLALSVSL